MSVAIDLKYKTACSGSSHVSLHTKETMNHVLQSADPLALTISR